MDFDSAAVGFRLGEGAGGDCLEVCQKDWPWGLKKTVRENGDVIGGRVAGHGCVQPTAGQAPRFLVSPSELVRWLAEPSASVMALPLLAGEASAQTVPRVLWSSAVHQDITEDTETHYL